VKKALKQSQDALFSTLHKSSKFKFTSGFWTVFPVSKRTLIPLLNKVNTFS